MHNNTLSKHTVSFGLALAISSVANALLVVAKEKSHAVQSGMQRLTGSHWITHVVMVLLLFFAIGFWPAGLKSGQGAAMSVSRLIKIILGGVFTAGMIIVGFYLVAN